MINHYEPVTLDELIKNKSRIYEKRRMKMAIQFKEMRPYLARNVRISLCLEENI